MKQKYKYKFTLLCAYMIEKSILKKISLVKHSHKARHIKLFGKIKQKSTHSVDFSG
ncbi:hypothetical protein HMPREF0548_0417 [Lactobacillus ultunensis DSM 16047]|uniref:Uncharacterized protein n=1 Tax=Lactobacillus ultunensis DSM 16047 TaxID=525365 RepID=C2EL71_9LACO|nr:hypothetical protein HMPREF0548_0417 [Lactobacillus ultunensis DSM 16047]